MSLYANYVRERTNDQIFETPEGFATYNVNGSDIYIRDIYVLPDFRRTGLASRIADEIAVIGKNSGCTRLLGSVCPSAKGSTESIKILLAYGFKLDSATNNFILFTKEI